MKVNFKLFLFLGFLIREHLSSLPTDEQFENDEKFENLGNFFDNGDRTAVHPSVPLPMITSTVENTQNVEEDGGDAVEMTESNAESSFDPIDLRTFADIVPFLDELITHHNQEKAQYQQKF